VLETSLASFIIRPMCAASPANRDQVLEQLARVLASRTFERAERSRALLTFLIQRTVEGESERLKEYVIGAEALGRGESFDPRTDTIVRAEASRLRARLARYYEDEGQADPLLFVLPSGGYVPQFVDRETDPVGPGQRVPSPPSPGRRTVWRGAAFVGAAVVVIAIVGAGLRNAGPAAPEGTPGLRFEVELRSDGTLGSQVGTDAIFTPDGRRIVFVARNADGLARIYTRRLDGHDLHATRLPGTDGARSVFVSPDGRWVGFWSAGKLRKVSVDGGDPVVLCDAADLLGAAWGDDGTIYAALTADRRLWRVPASGGTAEVFAESSLPGTTVGWPQVIPGTSLLLYTATSGDVDNARIEVMSLVDRHSTELIRGGTFGRFVPGGYLTYVNQGTLYGVPFDPGTTTVGGPAVPLAHGVSYSRTFGYAQVDITPTGTLVYRRGAESGLRVVAWIDRRGVETPILAAPGRYSWPRLSPDGRRLALSVIDAGAPAIWTVDLASGATNRFTAGAADYSGLMWSTDGGWLLFGGVGGLGALRSDLTGEIRRLSSPGAVSVPWSMLPDGSRLAYHAMTPGAGFDILMAPVTHANDGLALGTPVSYLATGAMETMPTVSPDGRWLAYVSNESGVPETYVRPLHASGLPVRVSSGGGNDPHWTRGAELIYRDFGRRVMTVAYRVERGSFRAAAPQPWHSRVLADTGVLPGFDLAPDGGRIVALLPAIAPEDEQSPNHVTVVFGFARDVQRRLEDPGGLRTDRAPE
jgi:Tol biopolymer transport system component